MTSRLRSRLLPAFAVALLLAFLATLAAPAKADMASAADAWTESVAGKSSDGFLKKLKDLKLDPSAKKTLKNTLKSQIKDKLKEKLVPAPVSLAMEEIIQGIRAKVKKGRGVPCRRAAMNVAWSALDVKRVLRGAAQTAFDLIGSTAGAPGLVKNIGASVLKKVKSQLEKELKDYYKNYDIETFAETKTITYRTKYGVSKCTVMIRVVWLKKVGQIHYLVLGDCNCGRIPTGKGKHTKELAKWSVSGRGTAKWIGKEKEQKIALDQKSTIKGRVRIKTPKIAAICCRKGKPGTYCRPWDLSDPGPTQTAVGSGSGRPSTGTTRRPTTGTKKPEPRVRTPQEALDENRSTVLDRKGKIPEIPEGPVCPDKKEELLTKIRIYIGDERMRADGPRKTRLDALNKALKKAESLEVKKKCDHSHAGLILPPGQSAVADDYGYQVAYTDPEQCVATTYYVGETVFSEEGLDGYFFGAPAVSLVTPLPLQSSAESIPDCNDPGDGETGAPVCFGVPLFFDDDDLPEILPDPEGDPEDSGEPERADPGSGDGDKPGDTPGDDQPLPVATATPQQEDEPDPEADLGLVKADSAVVALAVSGGGSGSAISGARLKLLDPPPAVPAPGAAPDPQLTASNNYQADVPGADLSGGSLAKATLVDAKDGGESAQVAQADADSFAEGLGDKDAVYQELTLPSTRYQQVVVTKTAGVAPGAAAPGLPARLAEPGTKVCVSRSYMIGNTPAYVVQLPQAAAGDFARKAEESGDYHVEPDPCRDKEELSDPFYESSGLWGQDFDNQWAIKRVGFDVGKNGHWPPDAGKLKPVTVAVIDSGLDWYHPDFPEAALWRNDDEIADNGEDDDNNGYVDDIIGWNFIDDSSAPWDYDGHGTFVAGVIAAGHNNGVGLAGINPAAKIMVLKALDPFGRGHASQVAEAITYAANNGAQVINLSLGGRQPTRVEQLAVDYARAKGAVIVVAAGNAGKQVAEYAPAGLNGVLTVSATDRRDRRAGFSNWGALIDVSAPGVDVLSLRARKTDVLSLIPGVKYETGAGIVGQDRAYYRASGTSFAAPIVAGIASLLLSRDPDLSAETVARILRQSARDIETPGVDQFTGYGMVDAVAALSADPDFFVDAQIAGVQVVQSQSGPLVEVLGTARANAFGGAQLYLGPGAEPAQWKAVAAPLAEAVEGAALGGIPAAEFGGSATWIIRLVSTHSNGKTREARYRLDLE